MRSLAWFIQVGLKCNDKGPYKSEAGKDLTQTEGSHGTRETGLAVVATSQGTRAATRSWKRQRKNSFLRAFQGGATLMTP